ncbi:MAG: DUF2950 family protein [Candidatus Omnitrophica bacterium]|nr:DUF2950 family protein [Candidatus Omnitrophota bacterium]
MRVWKFGGRVSLFTVFSLIALVLFMMAAWAMLDLSLNTYKKMIKTKQQSNPKSIPNKYTNSASGQLAKPQKMTVPSPIKTQTNPIAQKLAVGYYLFKAKMENANNQQIIKENEKIAINILNKYALAQEQYYQYYGYYCDSPDNLIIEGENKYTIIDPDLGVLNSATSPKQAVNGYYYVQTENPAAKPGQAQEYRLNAIPAEYGRSGLNSFCIDQKGNILQENNGGRMIYPLISDQTVTKTRPE